MMHYRKVGNSGLAVSALSLGMWQTVNASTDAVSYQKLIRTAFDAGVNYFDTADSYENGFAEMMLGKALATLPRRDIVVSTKCFFPQSAYPTNRGLSRKHIVESVNQSLMRLGLGHIDLFLCHRFDAETPIRETASIMADLIRQGKILYWGVSRWSAEQLEEAKACVTPEYHPIVVQSNYNLLNRLEEPVLSHCAAHGMGFTAYSPLAQGVLTEKYLTAVPEGSRAADSARREGMYDFTPANMERVRKYAAIAKEAGLPLQIMALAWCLRAPGMTSVLCGVSRLEQLQENLKALSVTLNDETLRKIAEVSTHSHA